MKKLMKTVLLTTTAFAMTGMVSCPKARADSGKTLNWSVQSDLETLDPQQCVDSTSGQMLNNVCEGLYRHGTNRLEKALAKSSKVSKDGLTWTFKLRKDGRWSNGDKVTAGDFVYAFRRAVDPKTNDSNANLFGSIKNAGDIQKGTKKPTELGVSAPDKYTLQVTACGISVRTGQQEGCGEVRQEVRHRCQIHGFKRPVRDEDMDWVPAALES